MEPISGVGSKDGVKSPKTFDNSIDQKFSNNLAIAKAGALLRQTGQHEKWLRLCQINDSHALKTIDIILKRHELLEKVKQNRKIDWSLFD